jgi:hypothetical protein
MCAVNFVGAQTKGKQIVPEDDFPFHSIHEDKY